MAHEEAHHQIPYEPIVDASSSPRLRSPAPPTSAAEFGAPNPGFLGDTYNNSSAASSTGNFRASNYGSIAPLQSAYNPTAAGNRDEDGSFANQNPPYLVEKEVLYAAPRSKNKRKLFWVAGLACGVILLIAIIVPVVYFVAIKKNKGSGSGGGGSGGGSNGNHQNNFATWGGDGSTVTTSNGSTFTYHNSFDGYWVYDPQNPLNNSARAQSYTPPLTEQWPWGTQLMYGVNIGGWLVLEPFISPALYEPFNGSAVDEWTLSTLLQTRDGNLNVIEDHYNTFITEEDFAQIAAAGLNWVRIPLPFWAIEVYPGEPFLAKTSWTYFLKAIEWARKYGLRINLDLHTIPGSQNGWNHSGKTGEIDFLAGVMGVANAQRAMDYIRIIAEFISQPEYQPVVPYFGIINEPYSGDGGTIPETSIREFYAQAYRVLRNAGGVGNGNGPFMSMHEAYYGLEEWVGFLAGADRIALDTHPYLIFEVLSYTPVDQFAAQACNSWASMFTASSASFGLTAAGEWSFAVNDCGEYLNGVGEGTRYEGTFDGNPVVGSCEPWNDYTTWNASTIAALKSLGAASMDSLGNSFFWTWKIGVSSISGKIGSPMWSYQLAIEGGWALTDPRTSAGTCTTLGTPGMNYTGPFPANEVGGSTTVSVPSLDTFVWPPDSIGGYASAAEAAELPRYTPTGAIVTLPIPTFTATGSTPTETASLGNGWNNPNDNADMAVPATGCDYPNPWAAVNATIPVCNVAATPA